MESRNYFFFNCFLRSTGRSFSCISPNGPFVYMEPINATVKVVASGTVGQAKLELLLNTEWLK